MRAEKLRKLAAANMDTLGPAKSSVSVAVDEGGGGGGGGGGGDGDGDGEGGLRPTGVTAADERRGTVLAERRGTIAAERRGTIAADRRGTVVGFSGGVHRKDGSSGRLGKSRAVVLQTTPSLVSLKQKAAAEAAAAQRKLERKRAGESG